VLEREVSASFFLPAAGGDKNRSAEGDSPLPEREVSSLHPSFPPPQAAKREFATALKVCVHVS